MTSDRGEPGAALVPTQVKGTVLTVRRVDAYYAMTVIAPGVAARFRPGQFVAVAVGGPQTSMLLRRAFSIHQVRPDHGGTVEFVFAVAGPGTAWLSERRTRDTLDLAGPLGRPFPLPYPPPMSRAFTGSRGSGNGRPSGPARSRVSLVRRSDSHPVPGPATANTNSTVPPWSGRTWWMENARRSSIEVCGPPTATATNWPGRNRAATPGAITVIA